MDKVTWVAVSPLAFIDCRGLKTNVAARLLTYTLFLSWYLIKDSNDQ
jgi:hypothetical protein